MGIDAKLLVVVVLLLCCVTQNLSSKAAEWKEPWWVENVKKEHSTPIAEPKPIWHYFLHPLPNNAPKRGVQHPTRVKWKSIADHRKARVQEHGILWERRDALPNEKVAFQSKEFREFIKTALWETSNSITMSGRKQPPTAPLVFSKTTTFNKHEYEIMIRVEALVPGLADFHDIVARLYLTLDQKFRCGGYTKPSVSVTSIHKVTFEYTILRRLDTTP